MRELAVQLLEGACESTDVLQMVVEMQPTLDHLGEVGHIDASLIRKRGQGVVVGFCMSTARSVNLQVRCGVAYSWAP